MEHLDTLIADPMALETRCCGKLGETYEYDANGDPKPIPTADGSGWSTKYLGCGQISLPHIQTSQQMNFNKFDTPWYNERYSNIRDNYEWRARTIPNVPGFNDQESELSDLYAADVKACWYEYRDKFITGALDLDADWEEYLTSMEAFGLPEMTQVYQSVYDRTR